MLKINWLKIHPSVYYIIGKMIAEDDTISLSNFRILLKQGYECKDCNKSYKNCMCNYCDYCVHRFCLCDLGDITEFTDEEYTKSILNYIYTWIFHNLVKKEIWYIIKELNTFYSVKNRNLKMDKLIELTNYENKLV